MLTHACAQVHRCTHVCTHTLVCGCVSGQGWLFEFGHAGGKNGFIYDWARRRGEKIHGVHSTKTIQDHCSKESSEKILSIWGLYCREGIQIIKRINKLCGMLDCARRNDEAEKGRVYGGSSDLSMAREGVMKGWGLRPEQGGRGKGVETQEQLPDRGNSKYKDPEEGAARVCFRDGQKAGVAGVK